MTDEEILKENGWEIECQSPFDIVHKESNSSASNWGAQAVVDDIIQTKKLSRIRLIVESYEGKLIDKDKFIDEILILFK